MFAVKLLMGAIALGVGIWYLSSSIGGAALTYSSTENFLTAIGVEDGNIANASGCFLCKYISDLFSAVGTATEQFWSALLNGLMILIALGFGLYIIYTGITHVWAATKSTAGTKIEEKKIEFKPWFEKIVKQGIRVLIVMVLLGGASLGGVATLKILAEIIITPILYLGGLLGMVASGIAESASCAIPPADATDILTPVMGPFMCVIGNINAVVLAGAAGGFALMNYAWLGLGGGLFTWIAGLGLVIMFLCIGFDLVFQILSVIFKNIFLIIFLPLFVASYAFEGAWKLANGLVNKGINMLIGTAMKTVVIALKVVIIYSTVAYSADYCFPGSAMLPPLLGSLSEISGDQSLAVTEAFATCESVSLVDGVIDEDRFQNCFTAKRAEVEREYPGAFDFLENGWDFMVMMAALFALYFLVLRNRIEAMLPSVGNEDFDFGGQIKQLGKNIWSLPSQIVGKIGKAVQ